MMALSKIVLQQEPSDIEMLLPWHAAGTLSARDARRVFIRHRERGEVVAARAVRVVREIESEEHDFCPRREIVGEVRQPRDHIVVELSVVRAATTGIHEERAPRLPG